MGSFKATFTGTALLAVAIVALPAQAQDIEREFDVQPGGLLNILSDAGPITVRSWEQSQVRVRVINPEAYEVSIDQSGNEVRVVGGRPRSQSYSIRGPGASGIQPGTGYRRRSYRSG